MYSESNQTIYLELNEQRDVLAENTAAERLDRTKITELRSRTEERAKYLQETRYQISCLLEAIAAGNPALFADYVKWAKSMLAARGTSADDLADNLTIIKQVAQKQVSVRAARVVKQYLDFGLARLSIQENSPTAVSDAAAESLSDLAQTYLKALLAGNRQQASQLILGAVENGVAVKDIYLQVFQPAQHEVGRLWQMNELSVAQEHYCTAATQLIMSQLYPHIFSAEKNGLTMVATCVSGDLHEIGVRMVSDFFEMEGWDTFYLGANTPTPALLQTLKERQADLIVISATMTFHLRAVKELIAAIRADNELQTVKIMVGGYPFSVAPELWREIGADAFSADALEAVKVAEKLVSSGGSRRGKN